MDEESSPREDGERLNGHGQHEQNNDARRSDVAAAARDPHGISADTGEAVELVPQPPSAFASLPSVAMAAGLPPPDFQQRSLREFSLPARSSSLGSHRLSRHSLSSNHQSQLRKQAHASPTFTSQRNPGLPSRSLSVNANSYVRSPQANHRPIAAAPLMDIRPPLLDIPRAAYTGRSVSAPAPVEVASESDMDVHCGWAVVDVMGGEAGGAPPCERSLHAAAVLNGNLCIFGGYDGHSRINDFHAYNFNEKRWSPVLPSATSGNPPSPRDRHVAVAYNNSFYVFGGFDGTSRINDFFSFDFSSMTWREVPVSSGQPPSARHSHAAVVHNHSMWVFGGYDGSYKSDLHEFDFDLNTWNAVNAAGRRPRARYRATCVVCRNLIVLFGGHDGTRHMADTHVFDIETRIWSALVTEGTPPTPRDSHVSLVQGSSMYIFGGSSGSAINDLHELQLPASPTSPAKWYVLDYLNLSAFPFLQLNLTCFYFFAPQASDKGVRFLSAKASLLSCWCCVLGCHVYLWWLRWLGASE